MKYLRIAVKDKIATYVQRDGAIVCGNKGYKIVFTFDDEWADYPTKTARFIWNNKYFDQQFYGNECDVPMINDTENVTVGVYAGDLKTTTPAVIPCLISILCGNPETTDGKIKEYRDEAQTAAEEAKNFAKEAKDAAQVVVFPTIDVEEIEGGHKLTINDVEGEKTFNVMDGGFTEEEAKLLAKLSEWYDKTHYQKMSVSFTANPATTNYEIGSSHKVIFSWKFSKLPVETTFNKQSVLEEKRQEGSEELTITSNQDTTFSYSIYGKYKDGETASATINIAFQNNAYYGGAPDPRDSGKTVDSHFIRSLQNRQRASSCAISFTSNCKDDEYIWYAYPARLGYVKEFQGGAFTGGFEKPIEVAVTNGSNFTEKYYVYRSINLGINLPVTAKS